MDHNMVLIYNYISQNRRRRRTNAPPSRAISMAMAVRQCDTEQNSQYSMTGASPEATVHRHLANTCSVSPRWLPGRQYCVNFLHRSNGSSSFFGNLGCIRTYLRIFMSTNTTITYKGLCDILSSCLKT